MRIDVRLREAILDAELSPVADVLAESLPGDDYPPEYYEDGFPKLPSCLARTRDQITATVRKRTWGTGKEAWILTYKDSGGKRRRENFQRNEGGRNIRRREVEHEIDLGIHTVRSRDGDGVERSSRDLFMKECERRRRLNDKMSGNTVASDISEHGRSIIAASLGAAFLLSDLTFLRLATIYQRD